MGKRGLVLFCLLLISCSGRQVPKESDAVRILKQLPPNQQCTLLERTRAFQGVGCTPLDNGGQGQKVLVLEALRLKARRAGANLAVVIEEYQAPYSGGCAWNQREMTADLYRCEGFKP